MRASAKIPTSSARGNSLSGNRLFALTGTETLQIKYLRRRWEDAGFPDFESPIFFSRMTLPSNNFDRVSARYEARSITPWFTNLTLTAHYQDQRRLVRTEFPVQYPVPSAAFFPINVYRLNLRTDTEQHVATPGYYDASGLSAGAVPAIDPATQPDSNGSRLGRTAVTGDAGAVLRMSEALMLRARYGRSYRHPNLEELLFSGPATIGAIVPNITVKPEVGDNIDLGLHVRKGRLSASASHFHNTYRGFISTEIVAETASGPLSQAINFNDVRIQGLEGDFDLPAVWRAGDVTLFGNAAYTRGTVVSGANPLTGVSLAGTPQDNISPFKATLGVRFTERRGRWWLEYGIRAQSRVTQFAPSRGRSFTVTFHVR